MQLQPYGELKRTTVAHWADYTGPGVYVIACYPELGCVYVGISYNVALRMAQHLVENRPFGTFMRDMMLVSHSWRLDILTPPDNENLRRWMMLAERRLVNQFRPIFNEQHLGELVQ